MMLIIPSDKNDMTTRFRRSPQGIVSRVFDSVGVVALATSVLALLVYSIAGALETEGTSLRVCLTTLNIAIICFIAARLVELADRILRMSNRDHQ